MQKIIFLSDLHGNMVATEAMAQEIRRIGPDVIWFLGDAVGKGPEGHKTTDWVRENCTHCIGGNWDYGICMIKEDQVIRDQNIFYKRQLGEERLAWLESLPREAEVLISGIRFRLIHGRPADQLYQGYDPDEKLAQGFTMAGDNERYGGLICADSHRPFVRSLGLGYALNTGSVGNSIGVPKAHALLIEGNLNDPEPGPIHITVLSVPYDNQRAVQVCENYPEMPNKEAFCKEVMTGVYSR